MGPDLPLFLLLQAGAILLQILLLPSPIQGAGVRAVIILARWAVAYACRPQTLRELRLIEQKRRPAGETLEEGVQQDTKSTPYDSQGDLRGERAALRGRANLLPLHDLRVCMVPEMCVVQEEGNQSVR